MAGTISRGILAPIIKQGDDIVKIVCDSVEKAMQNDQFELHNRDVIAMTEAIVARADGNYATVDDIAQDVKTKLGGETVGVIFPILSRNRFAICLRGIARGSKKIVLMLSYPSDEVGNHLISLDALDDSSVNPYSDVLSLEDYRKHFGSQKHLFTGIDYVDYYKSLIEEEGAEAEIIFANHPEAILKYTDTVICADIHSRDRSKNRLKKAGAKLVLTLCDIMNQPVNGSGNQPTYGLLGSNKATEEKVKLFPRNAEKIVTLVQAEMKKRTGIDLEVMVYGDGAFKDPVGKIWELADPVVGVAYTSGLIGLPNELKLKYLADNELANLKGDMLERAMIEKIKQKEKELKAHMSSEGTTPRRLSDLIGSLCDLTSGSGDKGTPIIVVQNYFNNFSNR